MNVARLEGKVAEKKEAWEASKQGSLGWKKRKTYKVRERRSVILTGFILHYTALQGKDSVIQYVWQVVLKVNF